MDDVALKEQEASEVLHSLLSVPRVEHSPNQQEVIKVGPSRDLTRVHCYITKNDDTQDLEISKQSVRLEEHVSDASKYVESTPEDTKHKKKLTKKRIPKLVNDEDDKIVDYLQEVKTRFHQGCDCNDDSCFRGLNPEAVHRHRLNIAELTKEEHDMYLMGVTMACLTDPSSTIKRKARQRLRSAYVYQGRKVCLSAFLYLENCTLYQLKRIRKHLTIHGVVPRVHGNHGKKPHNVFSLDIYRRATHFLKTFISKHSNPNGNVKSPVMLPSEISLKTIHKEYEEYVRNVAPDEEKSMGYSTFRHFMKEQFPQIRFCKSDTGQSSSSLSGKHSASQIFSKMNKNPPPTMGDKKTKNDELTTVATIPVILSEWKENTQQAFIVAPVENVPQQFITYQHIPILTEETECAL